MRGFGKAPQPSLSLQPKLPLQQFVHRLRVGLAAGGFHHLADKPAEHFGFGPGLLHLVGGWRNREESIWGKPDENNCGTKYGAIYFRP